MVKSIRYSCSRSGFSSQQPYGGSHPYGGSQPLATPVPVDSIPFSNLLEHSRYSCRKKNPHT